MQPSVEQLLEEDDFTVWSPGVDIIEKAGEDTEATRPIGGWCSTENLDRQDEVVVAKGLDFSEFVSFGHFNDNHKQETSAVLGYPRLAKLEKSRWWTEGNLLVGYGPSDKIWELAKALKKSNAPRRLGFSIEGKVLQRDHSSNRIIRAKVRNVAITNCFPGDTHVVGAGESVTRRRYSGPMVEVVLATGEKLSGTPNHPVLTQRGWVALGDLVEGYDRIGRHSGNPIAPTVVAHDVEHVPSTLQQAFDLAINTCVSLGVREGREGDFHGDGLRRQVDVVAIDGLLRRRFHTAFTQQFGEQALPASDKEATLLAHASLQQQFALRRLLPTAFGVGRVGQYASLGHGGAALTQALAFAVGSGGDAFSTHHLDDALPAHPIAFGNGERSLSSAVGFSDLVSKRVFDFDGHVFNIDTSYGWYGANGIVAHNCPVNTDCSWDILGKAFAPIEIVEEARHKALAAGHALRLNGGGALRTEDLETVKTFQRQDNLSFDDAVGQLQKIRPHLSKAMCRRIVRYAMCR